MQFLHKNNGNPQMSPQNGSLDGGRAPLPHRVEHICFPPPAPNGALWKITLSRQDLGCRNVSSGRTEGHRTVLGGKRESSGRTDNYRLRLRLKAAYARPRREASGCYLEWSALDAAPTILCREAFGGVDAPPTGHRALRQILRLNVPLLLLWSLFAAISGAIFS